MRSALRTPLVVLFMFCATASPALAGGGDTIFSPLTTLPAIFGSDLGTWFGPVSRTIGDIIKTVFNDFRQDPHATDNPNPNENTLEQLSARINGPRLKAILQGAGNLKMIGGPFLYSEVQGGVGIEYDFISTVYPSRDRTLIALRLTPLYGEIAAVRTMAEAQPIDNLPHHSFLGSAVGLEMAKRFGEIEAGVRVDVRQEWELGDEQHSGLGMSAAVYTRFHLQDVDWTPDEDGRKAAYYIKPMLAFYDRGAAKQDFYAMGLAQRFWEAMVFFEIKY